MKLATISAALAATVLGVPVDSATAVSSQLHPCIYRSNHRAGEIRSRRGRLLLRRL